MKELENFTSQVQNSEGYALLDFWADWCGPCRALLPVLEEVSEEFEDKNPDVIKFYKVDIDNVQNRETASEYQVRSVPTLIIFHKGKEVARKVGGCGKQELLNWIEQSTNE